MTIKHQLLALLVTFIWGTNFVFIKYGLDDFPSFLFAAMRFSIAAIPLVFFFPKPNVDWRLIAAYGLFIGVGQFGILFWAMRSDISPGLASLVIQSQAFFTILLAGLLMSEKIRILQMIALAISVLGILLIFFNTDGEITKLGLMLTLFGAASWACGNLVIKKVGSVDIIAFIAWSSLFAAVPLLLLSFYLEGSERIVESIVQASWLGWLALIWQTVGNTLIGYGLWNVLLREYSAIVVVPWSLLVPVFGMSASFLVLGESMPLWKLTAGALIISGLILNTYASRRKV